MAIFALVLKVKDMSHLTKEQRYTISVLRKENVSIPQIAKSIGVNKTTVYREIERNGDPKKKTYDSDKAQKKYEKRLRNKPRRTSFDEPQKILVRNLLSLEWSPEQITQRCRLFNTPCASHKRIYQFIWNDKRHGGRLYTYLRRKGRRKRKRGSNYNYRGIIPNRIDIDERPIEVNAKQRFGDLEGDTIIGKS
jgi:transposase, IS30 family